MSSTRWLSPAVVTPALPTRSTRCASVTEIDTSRREKHGALLNSYLLAEVYAELMGGRQTAMSLSVERKVAAQSNAQLLRQRPAPLASRLTMQEDEAHRAFAAGLGKTPIWKRYFPQDA